MSHTIARPAARPACRPLGPRQRAEVRQALAQDIGAGLPTSREDVVRRLYGAPAEPAAAVPAADTEVAVADAAKRLGFAEATVRRYLAPSSGKLARLGAGVSRRSLELLEGR